MGIFGILIAGIVLIGSLAGFVAMERKAGGDSVRSELQPKLTKCEADVEAQNQAILATKAEGDRRVAAASKGIARARTEAKAAISEAERLRTASKGSAPLGACPAASAAAEFRKGLK